MRAALTVVVVAGACLLTGCTGGDAAAPAPVTSTPTTSASPSTAPAAEPASPVAARPELPPEATVPDAAGAEAFVRHFYQLINYAYASGDSDSLIELSHVDCVGCAGLKANIDSATDAGAVWRDLTFEPSQFETVAPDADGISLSTFLLTRSPAPTVLEADGNIVDVTGAEVESVKFWSQWVDGKWIVFEASYPDRVS